MNELFPVNDGSRPSRLALARAATGELPPVPGPEAERYAAELDAARAELAPFDATILRAAAARVESERPRVAPRPWYRRLWVWPVLALAAALLVVLPRGPTNRPKGSVDLDFLVLRDGQVQPGQPGGTYRAGDRLQFTYRADGLDSLVLLSIDGEGTLTVFYPSAGEEPAAVVPGDRHVLEGSIELDDAPGPEVFVAIFGPSSVSEAEELALEAYRSGGADGLEALAKADLATDTVRIEKSQ